MRIIVEAGPKQGAKAIAVLVHTLLARHGIPTTLRVDGDVLHDDAIIKRNAVKAGERLQEPIEVTSCIIRAGTPASWRSRLEFDREVSETYPVVKGTWVTVGAVVSHIIDGLTWKEILTTHPELCEDDIRACLYWYQEQEGFAREYNQTTNGQEGQEAGGSSDLASRYYTRRCGKGYTEEETSFAFP